MIGECEGGVQDWSLLPRSVGVWFVFAGEVKECEFVDFEVGVVRFGPYCGAVSLFHHVGEFFVIFLICVPCNEKHGVVNKGGFELIGVRSVLN